ncbi:MAG: hypothetical protein H6719_15160 [Sandaracinaceae bacterium]|nr:hypothetical protein [Sandaracinaceae bacterium]
MTRTTTLLLALTLSVGCGNGIASDEAAERAYLGLDGMVGKALALGFDGFNMASSANIPPQSTTGDVTGTLDVSGQVDMGASDNKGMRLHLDLVDYQDAVPESDLIVTYDTEAGVPASLDLSLRGIPNATMTGSLTGTFYMVGDIEGPVTLDLSIAGMTEADPTVADNLRRVAGSTTVTGTATSDFGTYTVDVTL